MSSFPKSPESLPSESISPASLTEQLLSTTSMVGIIETKMSSNIMELEPSKVEPAIFDPSKGIPSQWKHIIISYNGLQCIGPTPPHNIQKLAELKAQVYLCIAALNAHFSPFYLDELEFDEQELVDH